MKADEMSGVAVAPRFGPAAPAGTSRAAPAGGAEIVRFGCGTCKKRLNAPARHAGRKGRCPDCGTVNRVPPVSEPEAPGVDPVALAVSAPVVASRAPVAVPAGAPGIATPAVSTATWSAISEDEPAALPRWIKPALSESYRTVEKRPSLLQRLTGGRSDRAAKGNERDRATSFSSAHAIDAIGMSPALKMTIVAAILLLMIATVWIALYLMIWSGIKLKG